MGQKDREVGVGQAWQVSEKSLSLRDNKCCRGVEIDKSLSFPSVPLPPPPLALSLRRRETTASEINRDGKG